MHWYFLIFSYKLTVSNGLSLTTLNSKEMTLCSGSFKWGRRTSPVSFSSNDCFKWVLIDSMDMHRVRLFSLAVLFGGRTSPVTFSLNDCFEWVLIDGMEICSCHFFVKQFQMGGRGGRGRTLAKVGSSARFELPDV